MERQHTTTAQAAEEMNRKSISAAATTGFSDAVAVAGGQSCEATAAVAGGQPSGAALETLDPGTLADQIIAGRRITRADDLRWFLDCDLDALCAGADRIRAACVGDHVDLCSIINARSGHCP